MTDASELTVHAAWSAFGVPDFSPPSLKLKTYLRMAKIPYAAKRGDPRTGPTKKIPFITFQGESIGDSGLIIEHLKKRLGDSLDAQLSPEQQALGHVIRRTCEESLYWALLYTRWADDAAWPEMARVFKSRLPPVIGPLIFRAIRKGSLSNAWGQGIARHTPENVGHYGRADIDALSTMLGDKPYLFGEAPTSYDASLYGILANVLAFPKDGVLATHVRTKPNLVAFVDRVRETYWATPDTEA